MKRTEALHKIKIILDNLEDVCTNKLRSEAILMEMERSGLIPPKVRKLKKYAIKNSPMEVFEYVNEWEDAS